MLLAAAKRAHFECSFTFTNFFWTKMAFNALSCKWRKFAVMLMIINWIAQCLVHDERQGKCDLLQRYYFFVHNLSSFFLLFMFIMREDNVMMIIHQLKETLVGSDFICITYSSNASGCLFYFNCNSSNGSNVNITEKCSNMTTQSLESSISFFPLCMSQTSTNNR